MFKTLHSFKKKSLTGTTETLLSSVHKKIRVINQLGHQLMSVGGDIKKYCPVSAKRNWKR